MIDSVDGALQTPAVYADMFVCVSLSHSCFNHYLVTTKHTHIYTQTHTLLDSLRIHIPESGSEVSHHRRHQPIRMPETQASLTSESPQTDE